MSESALVAQGGGRFRVSGHLTFATAGALLRDSAVLWQGGESSLTVDLDGVERADSAGLALLVEWMRTARDAGTAIRFQNIPDQLWAIARVGGLDDILPLQ